MSNVSKTTKILMAAAHLYPYEFERDIKERMEHPYKSMAPEFEVDIKRLNKEFEKIKKNRFSKSLLIFIIAFITFLIFMPNPQHNFPILFIGLFFSSMVEFIYSKSTKKKIRNIINNENHFNDSSEVDNIPTKKNLIIYGDYSPFIGAGIDLDSWSFTINLEKAENKNKPIEDLSVNELYNYINEKINLLKFDDMNISDELFVHGKDINFTPHFLPLGRYGKPTNYVEKEYISNRINDNNKRERHYKVIRIPIWEGQLILSLYYRLIIVNHNLFVEAKFFILPPLKEKYLNIYNMPTKPTTQENLSSIAEAIFYGTFSWIPIVIEFLIFISGGFWNNRNRKNELKKEVEYNRLYNYGWKNSLREQWASFSYEHYFQKIDKDFTLKLLTNEFLESILSYLNKKNISTEEFKQTSTKIINEGVIISGGEINTKSMAVGKGAKVSEEVKS